MKYLQLQATDVKSNFVKAFVHIPHIAFKPIRKTRMKFFKEPNKHNYFYFKAKEKKKKANDWFISEKTFFFY